MKPFKFIDKPKFSIEKDDYPNVTSIYNPNYSDEFGDFFDYSDGVPIDSETTQKWVNQVVEYLLKEQEEHYSFVGSGDTLVIGLRNDEEIIIYVSKKYMEANIPID